MRVKKILFLKTGNGDILKINTDIKNFIMKMQDKIKSKDKVINEYSKIINSTKKEYQKLNAENVRYKEILQQLQERF